MSKADSASPAIRAGSERWKIAVIDGPNMKHLGKRDPGQFGTIGSYAQLKRIIIEFGATIGVEVDTFVSDHEGDLLEFVHGSSSHTDGYIVDAGGLMTVSEALRHALQETKKPVYEVCFYNPVAVGEISVLTPTVIGRAMGLRQYSYIAGMLGLVLALDDVSFLNPKAPDSATVRRDGKPWTFRT